MAPHKRDLVFEDADLRQVDDAGDKAEHDGAVVAVAAAEEVDETGEFEDEPEVGADVYGAVVFCWWGVCICVGLLLVLRLSLCLVLVLTLSASCRLLLLVGATEDFLVMCLV